MCMTFIYHSECILWLHLSQILHRRVAGCRRFTGALTLLVFLMECCERDGSQDSLVSARLNRCHPAARAAIDDFRSVKNSYMKNHSVNRESRVYTIATISPARTI